MGKRESTEMVYVRTRVRFAHCAAISTAMPARQQPQHRGGLGRAFLRSRCSAILSSNGSAMYTGNFSSVRLWPFLGYAEGMNGFDDTGSAGATSFGCTRGEGQVLRRITYSD